MIIAREKTGIVLIGLGLLLFGSTLLFASTKNISIEEYQNSSSENNYPNAGLDRSSIYNYNVSAPDGMIVDNDGNTIIYGTVMTGVHLDRLATDIFLLKISKSGQRIWTTLYGGSGYEYIRGVFIDSENNIIFWGVTTSYDLPLKNQIIGEILASDLNEESYFIAKYDKNGKEQLSTYYNKIYASSIDFADNIIVVEEKYVNHEVWVSKISNSLKRAEIQKIFNSLNNSTRLSELSLKIDQENVLSIVGLASRDFEVNGINLNPPPELIEKNPLSEYGDGQFDIFVTKVDVNGDLIYSTYMGHNFPKSHVYGYLFGGYAKSFTWFLNSLGSTVVVIWTDASGQWDENFIPEGTVYKIGIDGNLDWEHSINKNLDLTLGIRNSVIFTESSRVIIVGRTYVSQQLDRAEIFIESIGANGISEWNKTLYDESDFGFDDRSIISSDNKDNIFLSYVTSFENEYFWSINTFHLIKIDPFGNIEWEYTSNSYLTNNYSSYFCIDDNQDVIILLHINPNKVQPGDDLFAQKDDLFVQKLTNQGDEVFQMTYGGEGIELFYDHEVTNNDFIIIIGQTTSRDLEQFNEWNKDYQPNNIPDEYGFLLFEWTGFILILDSNGDIHMSSYVMVYPEIQTETDFTPYLISVLILLSSIASCTWGIKLYRTIDRVKLMFDLEKITLTTQIDTVLSPLFKDTTLIYLLWGTTRKQVITPNLRKLLPENIFDYKYFFHPVRMSILKLLSDNMSLLTTEIRNTLGLTWNEYSSHLNSLKDKQMINITEEFIDGIPKNKVQIKPQALRLFNEFRDLLVDFLQYTDNFEDYLSEAKNLKILLGGTDGLLYPQEIESSDETPDNI